MVSIRLTPPPPLVSNGQLSAYPPSPLRQQWSAFAIPPPPPPAADVICEQPLTGMGWGSGEVAHQWWGPLLPVVGYLGSGSPLAL